MIRHAHRMSLGGFVAQHHNSLRFYFGLFRFPFTQYRPLRASGYTLLLLLAQVVYVWGYFSERIVPVKQVRA